MEHSVPYSTMVGQRRRIPPLVCQRRWLRLALGFSDVLTVTVAWILAYWIRFDLGFAAHPEVVPVPLFYFELIIVLVPVWLILLALFRLYDFHFLLGGTQEYARIFQACSTGALVVVAATFLIPDFVIARGWLLSAWLLSAVLTSSARFWLRRLVYRLRSSGWFLARCAVVGTNQEAVELAAQLADGRRSGLWVLGLVQSGGNGASARASGLPLMGRVEGIEEIVGRDEVEELVVATTALTREELLDVFLKVSRMEGVGLRLSTGLFEVFTTGVRVRAVGAVPLMSLNRLRLDPIERFLKGVLDYFGSMAGLIFGWPLFVVIAVAIKFDAPGPVFHRRRVMGLGGKGFDALKFRTMYVDGDRILKDQPELKVALERDRKLRQDPRITRVGTWLRRYSLDELPQLINVVLGQMSLVGPRMISPEEAYKYGDLLCNLRTVKPGMTGLWQVSGRSDLTYDERVRLDMHYIRNYSIWRDLQILLVQTLPVIIKGRGAY